jgi:hypothetical protein
MGTWLGRRGGGGPPLYSSVMCNQGIYIKPYIHGLYIPPFVHRLTEEYKLYSSV